jgi:hypothetical protein
MPIPQQNFSKIIAIAALPAIFAVPFTAEAVTQNCTYHVFALSKRPLIRAVNVITIRAKGRYKTSAAGTRNWPDGLLLMPPSCV